MDFDLTQDQQQIEEALAQMVERHSVLPVGDPTYVKTSPELDRDLKASGFLNIAREEGLGDLEAVMLIDAVAKIPYASEVAASALVAPNVTARELPGPIALTRLPLGSPIRFLKAGGTLLVDTGVDIRVIALTADNVEPTGSIYNFPYGRLVGVDPSTAPVLEGAHPDEFRRCWRLGLAAEIVGAMDLSIATTVAYVKERKAFNQPLGAFQAIQHRLSECAVMLNSARLLTREAAWSGQPKAAALAASYAQEAAAKVVYDCQQFHGAIGLTLEYPLHYWTYRLRQLQGELGGPVVLAQAAADMSYAANQPIGDPFGADALN